MAEGNTKIQNWAKRGEDGNSKKKLAGGVGKRKSGSSGTDTFEGGRGTRVLIRVVAIGKGLGEERQSWVRNRAARGGVEKEKMHDSGWWTYALFKWTICLQRRGGELLLEKGVKT